PPKLTAGLARSRVRGYKRSPAPPASNTPNVSLIEPARSQPGHSKPHANRKEKARQKRRAARSEKYQAASSMLMRSDFKKRTSWAVMVNSGSEFFRRELTSSGEGVRASSS